MIARTFYENFSYLALMAVVSADKDILLHEKSGQRALCEAGLFDEFRRLAARG